MQTKSLCLKNDILMKKILLVVASIMSIFFLVSCSSETNEVLKENRFKSIYDVVENKFEEVATLIETGDLSEYSSDILEKELNQSLSLYSRTDVETVLDYYKINPQTFELCKFFLKNHSEQNVFEQISTKFSNLTDSEIEVAFNMYFCGMIIKEHIPQSRISTSCAVSVGSAVVSCMSAVAISNVAGLAWWLLTYSGSLAGVMTSC